MKYIRVGAVRLYPWRLFPYGKSGLKCNRGQEARIYAESLPVWEEWIEIVALAEEISEYDVSSRMGRVD